MQEMEKGFSLSEEAWLAFAAQDPNIQQCVKVAAAIQNAIQCSRVIYNEEKKELLPGHRWIVFFVFFFKRVDRIEFSKEPNPVPTTSGVSEIAACPPSPVADGSFSSFVSHFFSLLSQ